MRKENFETKLVDFSNLGIMADGWWPFLIFPYRSVLFPDTLLHSRTFAQHVVPLKRSAHPLTVNSRVKKSFELLIMDILNDFWLILVGVMIGLFA